MLPFCEKATFGNLIFLHKAEESQKTDVGKNFFYFFVNSTLHSISYYITCLARDSLSKVTTILLDHLLKLPSFV